MLSLVLLPSETQEFFRESSDSACLQCTTPLSPQHSTGLFWCHFVGWLLSVSLSLLVGLHLFGVLDFLQVFVRLQYGF
jgi:hypothetical protein